MVVAEAAKETEGLRRGGTFQGIQTDLWGYGGVQRCGWGKVEWRLAGKRRVRIVVSDEDMQTWFASVTM